MRTLGSKNCANEVPCRTELESPFISWVRWLLATAIDLCWWHSRQGYFNSEENLCENYIAAINFDDVRYFSDDGEAVGGTTRKKRFLFLSVDLSWYNRKKQFYRDLFMIRDKTGRLSSSKRLQAGTQCGFRDKTGIQTNHYSKLINFAFNLLSALWLEESNV